MRGRVIALVYLVGFVEKNQNFGSVAFSFGCFTLSGRLLLLSGNAPVGVEPQKDNEDGSRNHKRGNIAWGHQFDECGKDN
jgi:hypothetical protein